MRRLYWVGPAAIVLSVLAVEVVRRISVALLHPIPKAFVFPLTSMEPIAFTAILVGAAVLTFAAVADTASHPIRTYRRLAVAVLVLSFIPDVAMGFSMGQGSWPPVIALALMHVAAWAVTVAMLTGRLLVGVDQT